MILVAYASRHGATQGIAERIAESLTAAGHEAEATPVQWVRDLSGYSAFVIGGAAYFGHWLRDAAEFVRRNHADLSHRPVWMFSSGPLGTDKTDAEGRDLREAAEPADFAELCEVVGARDHRVFYGALNPDDLGFRDRMIRATPAGKKLLPAGDFRDWRGVEAWAAEIAAELDRAPAE